MVVVVFAVFADGEGARRCRRKPRSVSHQAKWKKKLPYTSGRQRLGPRQVLDRRADGGVGGVYDVLFPAEENRREGGLKRTRRALEVGKRQEVEHSAAVHRLAVTLDLRCHAVASGGPFNVALRRPAKAPSCPDCAKDVSLLQGVRPELSQAVAEASKSVAGTERKAVASWCGAIGEPAGGKRSRSAPRCTDPPLPSIFVAAQWPVKASFIVALRRPAKATSCPDIGKDASLQQRAMPELSQAQAETSKTVTGTGRMAVAMRRGEYGIPAGAVPHAGTPKSPASPAARSAPGRSRDEGARGGRGAGGTAAWRRTRSRRQVLAGQAAEP